MIPTHYKYKCFLFQTSSLFWMLYSFFWMMIPRRLKFMCRRFGTLCFIFIGRVFLFTRTIKMEQSVLKRWHIKFRRREITPKKSTTNTNICVFLLGYWPKHVGGHYVIKLHHKIKVCLLVFDKFYTSIILIQSTIPSKS